MPEVSRGFPRVPWNLKDVGIAVAVVFLAFFIFLLIMGLVVGVGTGEGEPLVNPWVTGVLEGLLLAAAWFFGLRKYGVGWRYMGLKPPEARWSFALPWLALLASLAFTGAYSWVVGELGLEILRPEQIPPEALGEGPVYALNVAVIGLWGPFTEEVFFRGFILAALVPVMGVVRAAAVSALVFTAAHLMLGTLIPIFVTGLLLAWLYVKTKSIWPPIVAHAAQNILAITALGQEIREPALDAALPVILGMAG